MEYGICAVTHRTIVARNVAVAGTLKLELGSTIVAVVSSLLAPPSPVDADARALGIIAQGPVNSGTDNVYGFAETRPSAVALIDARSGEVLTYGGLGARANAIANALLAAGAQAGDVLASIQRNSFAQWELVTAAFQIGLRVVPIASTSTREEFEWILQDCAPSIVVVDAPIVPHVEGVLPVTVATRIVVGGVQPGWVAFDQMRLSADIGSPRARQAGIFMHYTAGTTGRPKAVHRAMAHTPPELVAHRIAETYTRTFHLPTDGVALLCSPAHHAAPGNFVWAMLNVGYTVVILDRFDAKAVLSAIRTHGITTLSLVPTHVYRLLQALDQGRGGNCELLSLRTILVAGAAFPAHIKAHALARLGPIVWELYAATEAFICAISPEDALTHPGSVGKPKHVRILNDKGSRVRRGEIGTVWFRLSSATRFHYTSQSATAARVRYATCGDLGFLDVDGFLHLTDRRVDIITSGGINISPREVEDVLSDMPATVEAIVLGVPDEEWGRRVVAVVELYPKSDIDTAESALRATCMDRLSSAKHPRQYIFVDELPRSAIGKPDRQKAVEVALNQPSLASRT